MSRVHLLTGAGFTANFGGYLADQMWNKLFNHGEVASEPRVKDALRRNAADHEGRPNFERAYQEIMSGPFNSNEKRCIQRAVESALRDLDRIVQQFQQTPHSISLNEVGTFILRFAGQQGEPGHFFTVNQDLFVERRLPFDGTIVYLPGLRRGERFQTRFNARDLRDIKITLPSSAKEIEENCHAENGHLRYVKLHGSTEWVGGDVLRGPIIGTQKSRMIADEPLLKWYSQMFRETLTSRPAQKLLVIGYSFRDEDINNTLAQACKNNGLRVYVMDPATPGEIQHRLWGRGDWQKIWKSCERHEPWPPSELFSPNGTRKLELQGLIEALFEDK